MDAKLDLLIKSRQVVFENGVTPCSIGVVDGRVTVIADWNCDLQAGKTVDCGELPVLPGVVDPHVHFKNQVLARAAKIG